MRVVVPDDFNAVYEAAPAIARLRDRATRPGVEVVVHTAPWGSLEELVGRLRGAEVIIANRERTPLHAGVLAQLPDLRLIAQTGLRGQHLDLAAAAARGILVGGTAGEAAGTSTAELAIALMLAALRRLPYGDAELRAGRWSQVVGREARGRTLGVIGLGRIGGQVAQVARALGMAILAWSPTLIPERAAAQGATARPLDDLLREADVATVHLRLTPESRGLLSRAKLELLRPDALLVNTARAAILDEAALVELLRAGRLWGAALDVFAEEPLPPGHPLLGLPNVVLSPHVGWVAEETYAEYIGGAVETVLAYLDGRPLPHPLLPDTSVR